MLQPASPQRLPLLRIPELRLLTTLTLLICGAVYLSTWVTVPPLLHQILLLIHLGMAVVALGAVVTVDWYGFLWVRGQARFGDVLKHADRTTSLIWGGLAGLVVTGAFLEPDLDSRLVLVKMVAVVGVAAVGVCVLSSKRWMQQLPGAAARLVGRGLVLAVLSQLCWWTAVVVGFISNQGRA